MDGAVQFVIDGTGTVRRRSVSDPIAFHEHFAPVVQLLGDYQLFAFDAAVFGRHFHGVDQPSVSLVVRQFERAFAVRIEIGQQAHVHDGSEAWRRRQPLRVHDPGLFVFAAQTRIVRHMHAGRIDRVCADGPQMVDIPIPRRIPAVQRQSRQHERFPFRKLRLVRIAEIQLERRLRMVARLHVLDRGRAARHLRSRRPYDAFGRAHGARPLGNARVRIVVKVTLPAERKG